VQAGYVLTYQWKKDGVAISGATLSTYTTPSLTLADNGASYTCDVTGRTGTVTSNAAVARVQPLGTATPAGNTTSTALPDNPAPEVIVPIAVSGVQGNVGEVTVSLYITHTYIGDQKITLESPDGTKVVISNNAGGDGSNTSPTGAAFGTSCANATVFNDKGATSIDAAIAPPAIVGTFRPSFPLSAFTGHAPNGTWKLHFIDLGPGDSGTFNCGTVSIKPLVPSLDVNVDGVVDVFDGLELLKRAGTAAATDLAKADFNADGAVDDTDLQLLLGGL
ncbi:MAG: proprotein convertase P-domain-containing protein, partial [Deltaproteobacteria bacterium]|nr:proprotein convertase P-domain-containing protein [Deltaproteobacteria bacterium]